MFTSSHLTLTVEQGGSIICLYIYDLLKIGWIVGLKADAFGSGGPINYILRLALLRALRIL